MTTIAETAGSLLAKAKALQEALEPTLTKIQESCEKATRASQTVGESWSGSSLGYHSELYFRDFERPPLAESFDPEWGGIHGISAGWQTRSPDEVKARIEQIAGNQIEKLEEGAKAALDQAKSLQTELLTELSPLHTKTGLEKEKKLFGELENFKWGQTANEYLDANLPKSYVSRDSRAVYQGAKVSAHLFYAAVAFETHSKCAAIRESLKKSVRLLRQTELNAGTLGSVEGADPQPLKGALTICDRFHRIARQLAHRREDRTTLKIKDEYDVQDLLHALLNLYFDDIRPEEWTPSYGGGASRMDFLLKDRAIVVEAKMTRKGLTAKEVSEQLIIDAARYRQHPDCKTLICFVYDPEAFVKNPRGVERDLAKLSGNGLEVVCVITP